MLHWGSTFAIPGKGVQDLCTDTGLLKEVGAPGELSVEGMKSSFCQ